MRKFKLSILMLLASGTFAQQLDPLYAVIREVTLPNAAAVVTVQQPATGAARVVFDKALIYCSVACTVTPERDGTAATTTAQSVVALSHGSPASVTTAFVSSNVGTGTQVGPAIVLAAGEKAVIDLPFMMLTSGTNVNFTLRTNAITGDVKIMIRWREYSGGV